VHEGQVAKRERRDEREGSDKAAGKGEISTLLTSVPGLAAVGAFGADVAILVALKAAFDAWAVALVESVAEGVLDVVGGVVKAVTPLILSRLHALRLCFLLTLFVRPDCLYRLPDSLRTLPLSRYLAALVSTRLTMLTFLFRICFSRSRCLCLLSLFP
jgi:hypothetical protein